MESRLNIRGQTFFPLLLCLVSLIAFTASVARANFIGDLVFCDENGDNRFDLGVDRGLNDITIRVVCTDALGNECADLTTTTGTIDDSVLSGGTQAVVNRCSANLSSAPLTWDPTAAIVPDGRWMVDVFPSCQGAPFPWTCTATVDPNTAPADCNVLTSPLAGGPPFDTCNPNSATLAEGQVLGTNSSDGGATAACFSAGGQFQPDGPTGNGAFTTIINQLDDNCNLGDDYCFQPPAPVCGDGVLDPGEECDDGNNLDGDGCSATCVLECNLDVTKTCLVPPPPTTADACDVGKPTALVFRYTGDDCSVLTNPQGDKAKCSGPLNGDEPVEIVITKDADKITVTPSGETIFVGDLVSIARNDGNRFAADTKFDIVQGDTVLQSLSIHTSCSKVLGVGDQFGSMLLTEFTAENGTVVTLPTPPVPTAACEIPSQEGVLCTKRPTELSLRFNGGDCSQSMNTQDPKKVSCSGDAGAGPVRIVATDKKGDRLYLDMSDIQVGDVMTLVAANVGRSDLDSDIEFDVFDANGTLVQEIRFHTSCSQPLRLGDTFGSLAVVSFQNATQGLVQVGANVQYAYRIENTGSVSATNITVTDDPLGSIGTIAALASGQVEVLTTSAFIDQDTTNTVTVIGETSSGAQCSAMDSATVTVVPPPPPPFVCQDAKPITSLTLIWSGPSGIDIVTEGGQVITGINTGDEVTFSTAGLGNDVDVTLSGTVSGTSRFHVSCSDQEMNGPEDCGSLQGNGKDNNASRINDWLFEGMAGNLALDCTP